MAFPALNLFPPPNSSLLLSLQKPHTIFIPHCTSNSSTNSNSNSNLNSTSDDEDTFPELPPDSIATSFNIEKRQRSTILRDRRRGSAIQRKEPPNFEIGWKRTKEIKIEKPKGWMIADFLEKLEGLIERRQYGSAALLSKVGEVVAMRACEEAEVLMADGEVEERMVTELRRVLRLMEMDLAMVRAAVKEETLSERLEQARARCRQAILVALSF